MLVYFMLFTLHLYLGGAGSRGDCDDILVGSLMYTTKQKDLKEDVGVFYVAKTKILYYFIPLAPASQRILQMLGLLG